MQSIKKALLALFMTAVIGTTGFGQGFSIGPKVGLNISNYTGGDIKSDALVGGHFGGVLNFGIGRVFSVQPEVLFSTQGAKIDNAGKKTDFKVNYVTIPIMLKVRTNGGFYIEAGPQASFKAGEDSNIGGQTIDKFAKGLDLSLGGGIGYQTGIGLGIGARYVAGLSKVGDFDNWNTIKNPDFKNSVIQVSVFWAIPLKKY